MSPDEQAFRADIAKGTFQLGQVTGRWKVLGEIVWPIAHIAAYARDGRAVVLRFDLSNYPDSPPTARPWDMDRNAPLEAARWPQGPRRVSAVFNPGWKGGSALYLPCDRISIEGHGNWKTELPSKLWQPSRGIVQYLELVHGLLTSHDYQVPTGALA